MKIVTYNMHVKKNTRWAALYDIVNPDIVLAQEMREDGIKDPHPWFMEDDSVK